MMKTFNKIIGAAFVLILVAVVGLFVLSLLPIPGKLEVKIVKSGSMEPVIKTGGIVFIRPVADYKIGDIITFGADTKVSIPTTHRIVAISERDGQTYYQTKGDANNAPDQDLAAKSSVLGKVFLTLPYAGYIINFARQPVGFVLLIAVPAGLVVLYEALGVWEEVKKMRQKKREEISPEI